MASRNRQQQKQQKQQQIKGKDDDEQNSMKRFSYADIANGKRSVHSTGPSRIHENTVQCCPAIDSTVDVCPNVTNSDAIAFVQKCVIGNPNKVTSNESEHSSYASSDTCEKLPKDFETSSSMCTEDRWQAAVANMERERMIREKIGLLINQRYEILLKISFGTYGSIYSAYDTRTRGNVAVKFVTGVDTHTSSQLQREYEVYCAMKGVPGIPVVHWFGTEFDHQILVMQLLGPSLAQLYNYCDHWFTRETISRIGQQMLDRLRSLHSHGYVHRDVKPENFLMGIADDEETCFLIDFGLARRFWYKDGARQHIPFQKGHRLVGTAKYASINSHKGMTLSRRDDLESLGYVLIEFINRTLPWTQEKNARKKGRRISSKEQSYNRIRVMKERLNWIDICPELANWISYCTQLDFTDEPDYDYLRSILQSISTSSDGKRRDRVQNVQKLRQFPSSVHHPFSNSGIHMRKFVPGNYDDGSQRYSWIMRRESSCDEKLTYKCLYRYLYIHTPVESRLLREGHLPLF